MIISDEAFEYLRWQAGDIWDLQADRERWDQAYESRLQDQWLTFAKAMPSHCRTVLDVGSGLGGIDALLNDRLGGVKIVLLDGDNGDPRGVKGGPHNSMAVASRFLAENGCDDVQTMTPLCLQKVHADLVISFAAWCFHFPPAEYLDFVESCCHSRTRLILDVRRDKPEWDTQLRKRFQPFWVLHETPKFMRTMFRLV